MESYLIKSSLVLIILYLLYRLFVYQQSSHQLKRILGLAIVTFYTLFLFIPSFELSAKSPLPIRDFVQSSNMVDTALTVELPKEGRSILMISYISGLFLFSTRFVFGIWGILKLYIRSTTSKKWGFTVVETDQTVSPFSFFNYLFIQKGESKSEGFESILIHEQVHKDQLHSADVIFLEVITVLFWFNPFMWLLKKDIKASHEFLADEHVINNGYNKLDYQDLLFKARTGVSFRSASYLSNQTSLKQRFNYMEKRKFNSKQTRWRTGIVLVAMVMTVLVSSFISLPESLDLQKPTYRLYTAQGEVDSEKGISRNTDVLYIRAGSSKSNLTVRVSKAVATLVSGGRGLDQIEDDDSVDLNGLLSKIPEGKASTIVLEIQEYQTRDENGKIEEYKLRKPHFISLKIH